MFARLALFALTVLVACSGVGGLALSSRLGFCSSVPVWFALAALCDKLRAGAASVGWRCVVRRFAVESRARAANGYRVVGGVGRRPCNRERVRKNGTARTAQTGAGAKAAAKRTHRAQRWKGHTRMRTRDLLICSQPPKPLSYAPGGSEMYCSTDAADWGAAARRRTRRAASRGC